MSKKISDKVVHISSWYLVLRILFQLGAFFVYFVILWMISVIFGLSDFAERIGVFGATTIALIYIFDAVLYWKNSGIYITKNGDHIVKQGGWFIREEKLLNGVVVANEVHRNPIDQVLGTASILTGLFDLESLRGVRYKDIQEYDNTMRSRMNETFTSIF